MSDLVPFDPKSFDLAAYESVGALPWEVIAGLHDRYRLVVGAWLAHRRAECTDGTWGEHLLGYAHSLDRSPRTLSDWIKEAVQTVGVELPALPEQGRGGGPKPKPKLQASATSPDTPSETAEPLTREAWTMRVASIRNADVTYLRTVDRAVLEGAYRRPRTGRDAGEVLGDFLAVRRFGGKRERHP